ncbi:hypothetical protein [Hoeflea sp. EC-HK425]|uniref:hypothetical protein n=1 Tax=Hoeflea sp. EC-HK425 TaxID=2038388 RepID=UPI001253E7A4|nr:hypothetical protein [Hoeflea sp. EC-HK425]VVT18118.1 conserved hypothetical protein [Hoeflea sp. EC-HK425]|tara:strand:- start:193 stop:1038 length:846 start_codon:yes stop_codon:yes gene_type:complete
MLELNAAKFFDTLLEVRRVKTVIDTAFDSDGKAASVTDAREMLRANFEDLAEATSFVGAELASMAASRMAAKLFDSEVNITMAEISHSIEDVESRFRDECQLVTFVVLNRNQKMLFGSANELVGNTWDLNKIFPDAARELEESAKCIALQRPTASVFHAMRMLEVGIKILADKLGIDEITEPAKRNWGNILNVVKSKIDSTYPKNTRVEGSEGAKFERLYVSLDAVKNPWRNGTMHVESFYSEAEALHILRCVTYFLHVLAAVCMPDEVGLSLETTSEIPK